MSQTDFSDATLVLFGHGTTLNEESAAPVYQHAAELRRRHHFAEVLEGFWKQPPLLTEIVGRVQSSRVFLVPLFISEGYFCEVVIPRALGFANINPEPGNRRLQRENQSLRYCKPVGSHDSMTGVLLARASEVVNRFPFPRAPRLSDLTLFIAGHGTGQNENSRLAAERQAEIIRAKNHYAAVHAVFMEEEPRIESCYSLAQTKNIVVVPFFISDGLHVREDIPVMLGEAERIVRQRLQSHQPAWRNPTEKKDKRVWYSAAVGTEPLLAEVIMDRVREAAGW